MKLKTDPYKGVRDFYPEDKALQNHIFEIWKNIAQKYGYQEYNASVLEPAELYRAKTGEEIVNEQTYTFIDRGDREVTLRPEMTPTVARMVAAKKRELGFPLRWFSIPNLFRYEQPQKGRVREHWQLNVDIFGVKSLDAEVEIIQIAYDIMENFVNSPADYEIRINSRKLVNYVSRDILGLDEEQSHKLSKIIDKKRKIPDEVWRKGVEEIAGEKSQELVTLLNSENFEEFTKNLPQTKEEHEGLAEIRELIARLEKLGITNTRFDQTLMRGLDYYTGIVFEIFDKNPENRRSVFGGGRYDNLLSIFGGEEVPAVGFGAGDVVIQDLMESYGKKPATPSPADIYICVLNKESAEYTQDVAQSLRKKNMRVAVDYSYRKIGDQIKSADKLGIKEVICIGDEEVKTGKLKIKRLADGEEREFKI